MKKWMCIVLLAALICAALPVWAGADQADEKTLVRVSEVTHSVFYAPQYAAMALGFFEEEGLEIDLMNGGGADRVMTSVLTGEVDIGLAGPEACIYVLLEGHRDAPRVFAQLTQCDGSFIVGRREEVFSWQKLKGRTIIGGRKGGMPEMTLEYVMRQNGVIPHVDAVVDTSVQFNMMAGAFIGGDADYVSLFEPTATEVELAGQGVILCSVGEHSGEIPYTAYFAAQSYLTGQADTVLRFTRAIARGQQWVYAHSDRELAELLVPFFPDTSADVLEKVAARYKGIRAWKETPDMKQEALERLQSVMAQAGELDTRVDFDALVDNRFACQIMAEMPLE